MTLGPLTSQAIWDNAQKPRGPIEWLIKWLGRLLIFGFACGLAIITLGVGWRWPFVMVSRWYWYDYLVRQVRKEIRAARKLTTSDWEAIKVAEVALVRRGLMEPLE